MIMSTGYAYMEVDISVDENLQRLRIVFIGPADAFKSTGEQAMIGHTTQSVGANEYVPL